MEGIQSVTLASGTDPGTLKLTVDGDTVDNISVEGLGSAAYEATSAFATSTHDHDGTYLELSGGAMTGSITPPRLLP